jgi:hypothetical protein
LKPRQKLRSLSDCQVDPGGLCTTDSRDTYIGVSSGVSVCMLLTDIFSSLDDGFFYANSIILRMTQLYLRVLKRKKKFADTISHCRGATSVLESTSCRKRITKPSAQDPEREFELSYGQGELGTDGSEVNLAYARRCLDLGWHQGCTYIAMSSWWIVGNLEN